MCWCAAADCQSNSTHASTQLGMLALQLLSYAAPFRLIRCTACSLQAHCNCPAAAASCCEHRDALPVPREQGCAKAASAECVLPDTECSPHLSCSQLSRTLPVSSSSLPTAAAACSAGPQGEQGCCPLLGIHVCLVSPGGLVWWPAQAHRLAPRRSRRVAKQHQGCCMCMNHSSCQLPGTAQLAS